MPQQNELQWVNLSDFTPGIWSRSERALSGVALPAPLGAAQQTNTFRCQALPGGGLAPLPKNTASWSLPSTDTGVPTAVNGVYINGFHAFGPVNPATQYWDELFLGIEYIFNNAGSNQRRFRLNRYKMYNNPGSTQLQTAANFDQLVIYDSTVASPVTTRYWGQTYGTTRINTSDPTQPGTPVVFYDWTDSDAPAPVGKFISTFPSPSTASVTAILTLGNRQAQTLGHQGRIVFLEASAYAHGGGGTATATNEQIGYSTPNTTTITTSTQSSIFSFENPVGYGAWGSISAGELFLVKTQGGGLIISGDIANPSITRLPGVISTGGLLCKAASTPQGLFYAANRVGVCVWRGGDTSEVVSEQLDGDFFRTSFTPIPTESGIFLNAISTSLESWGPWVMVSNNWLYNTILRSWWRIEDPSVATINWWAKSSDTRWMWGATATQPNTTTSCVYVWDQVTPASSYSWQSHPIPASIDRLLEVREMVLVAQGSGTVTVTLTGIDPAGADTTQAETFTVSHSNQPQRIRPSVGGTFIKGYNVIVRIQSTATSTGAAPVVYSLSLGTRQAQQVVNT